MSKSNFERAILQFGAKGCTYTKAASGLEDFRLPHLGYKYAFKIRNGTITAESDMMIPSVLETDDKTTVGEICKFIWNELFRAEKQLPPPEKLKGTGTGGFEELLTKEGERLEKLGLLTLGRYPVASVIIQGSSRPMQVPSLPDFEGVLPPDGRQFVFEVKVCTQSAFEIVKDKVKPKQINHMLKRSRFGVPGWLLIHFNAREGKTFYDPAFTVAIPIKPEKEGGLPVWEKFAADKKGIYAGSIDRAEARKIGKIVPWHMPPRCTTLRPNLAELVL